jgi:hypothetical protein
MVAVGGMTITIGGAALVTVAVAAAVVGTAEMLLDV